MSQVTFAGGSAGQRVVGLGARTPGLHPALGRRAHGGSGTRPRSCGVRQGPERRACPPRGPRRWLPTRPAWRPVPPPTSQLWGRGPGAGAAGLAGHRGAHGNLTGRPRIATWAGVGTSRDVCETGDDCAASWGLFPLTLGTSVRVRWADAPRARLPSSRSLVPAASACFLKSEAREERHDLGGCPSRVSPGRPALGSPLGCVSAGHPGLRLASLRDPAPKCCGRLSVRGHEAVAGARLSR